MFRKEFDSSYVGFMRDGAKWLVENTDIKLVGKICISFFFFLVLPSKGTRIFTLCQPFVLFSFYHGVKVV